MSEAGARRTTHKVSISLVFYENLDASQPGRAWHPGCNSWVIVRHAADGPEHATRRGVAALTDLRFWAAAVTVLVALLAATPSEAIALRPAVARISSAPRTRPHVPEKRQADGPARHRPVAVTLWRGFKRRLTSASSEGGRAATVGASDARRPGSSLDPRCVIRPVWVLPSHWGATHLSI